jgi:hypothetical protein
MPWSCDTILAKVTDPGCMVRRTGRVLGQTLEVFLRTGFCFYQRKVVLHSFGV